MSSFEEKNETSKKPEDSDFQQQRLKAWQPLLTPNWVIGTFLIIGAIFIPIGVVILHYSDQVVEYETRYDTLMYDSSAKQLYPPTCPREPAGCQGPPPSCVVLNTTDIGNCSLPLTIKIEKDMNAPVFFYYKLTNYYQNHRRYVKSRSDSQLRGEGSPDLSGCDPLEKSNGKTIYPCGLIANSFFTDTFSARVKRVDGTMVTLGGPSSPESEPYWQKEGIAWKSDKDEKFKLNPAAYSDQSNYAHKSLLNYTLPPVTDEDFIVWMRTAGLPTFKKLYRKINTDLKAGDTLEIKVVNTYPVSDFDGEKAVVVSTTSWLGGKNSFLGWAYIVVGIICVVLALVFGIKHKVSPRPLGDMKYFNWPGASRPNAQQRPAQ